MAAANIVISTHPYTDGGFGWYAQRQGERTAIGSSENPSKSPENARIAAIRWLKKRGIGAEEVLPPTT